MHTRARPQETISALRAHSSDGLASTDEGRRLLRQALAALGQPGRIEGPPPLDGLPAEDLMHVARAALVSGLVEDLSWAPTEHVGVALYELTSVLPSGKERNALGRRLLTLLYEATAATFAAVATRMAHGARRALETPAFRARLQLVFALPADSTVFADALALTLVARRELFERWVAHPAHGTLPQRRLSASLLERAAREVVRCTRQGDPGPLNLFLQPWVQAVYRSLLLDREPLVWRHAAVCRGILTAVHAEFREELDLQLDPSLGPTEWRRATVSLVACLAHDRATAMQQCKSLQHSDLGRRHPALVATMVWGLGPVMESEPDAALELLDFLAGLGRHDVAENVAAFLSDLYSPEFAAPARDKLRRGLLEQLPRSDPTTRFAIESTLRDLVATQGQPTLPALVRSSLAAFEHDGAKAAYESAREALQHAERVLDGVERLAGLGVGQLPHGRLAELDQGALGSSRLYDLLLLDRGPGDLDASVVEMEQLYDRLGAWLMKSERSARQPDEVAFERRRWLSLLHLIDVETATRRGAEHVAERVAWRIKNAISSMLERLAQPARSGLQRVLCATLARSFDAAVREGVADIGDLLLLCLGHMHQPESVSAVIQASTSEDVRHMLSAYQTFLGPDEEDKAPPSVGELYSREPIARRFVTLSTGLHVSCSYRGEALRRTLMRLAQAVSSLEHARGLTPLCTGRPSVLEALEGAAVDLTQLLKSAEQRVLGKGAEAVDLAPVSASLQEVVALATSAGQVPPKEPLAYALQALCDPICPPLALPLSRALAILADLPCHPPSSTSPHEERPHISPLPDWLLPRRTIGSFYVVQSLGSGGTSSVFVARRIEERHLPDAERYALKVPIYDANVARHLTEQEFLQLFRQEAGALLALPHHTNLARFVNFDAEAKPRPILVMELIAGESLDDALRRRRLAMSQVLGYLDGILAGLAVMHSVGVAHLDVKPANVILRDRLTPVLVDFGLSGRQIRPGCGTLEYCAPEILRVPETGVPSPAPADIYAFACLAFEALTADYLMEGNAESSLIAAHMGHDGWPPRLLAFSKTRATRDVAVLLARCLRRDPTLRPSAIEVREGLALAGHALERLQWPLPLRDRAP